MKGPAKHVDGCTHAAVKRTILGSTNSQSACKARLCLRAASSYNLVVLIFLLSSCASRPLYRSSVAAASQSLECALDHAKARHWTVLDVWRRSGSEGMTAIRKRTDTETSERLVVEVRGDGGPLELKVALFAQAFYVGQGGGTGTGYVGIPDVRVRKHQESSASSESLEDVQAILTVCSG